MYDMMRDTCPEEGCILPAKALSKVVFPDPEAPTI